MRAGLLRHRVQVQSRTTSYDAHGQEIGNWETDQTRWAHVSPLTGREFSETDAQLAEANVRVRMRYYSGLSTNQRLLYGSRVLDIVSVVNTDERDRQTVVLCIERL